MKIIKWDSRSAYFSSRSFAKNTLFFLQARWSAVPTNVLKLTLNDGSFTIIFPTFIYYKTKILLSKLFF